MLWDIQVQIVLWLVVYGGIEMNSFNVKTRRLLNQSVALLLLVAMVSCNAAYIPSSNSRPFAFIEVSSSWA